MRLGSRVQAGPAPSAAVVEAVADAEGVEVTALDPPLHAAVDPDALDALFTGRAESVGRVRFRYLGYGVTVDGHGQVTLDGDGSTVTRDP